MRGAEETRMAFDRWLYRHNSRGFHLRYTRTLKNEKQGWFLLRLNNTVHLSKSSGHKSHLEEFG